MADQTLAGVSGMSACRTPSGASDGRAVRLTVTEAGAARVEQWHDIRTDLAGRALDRLSAADRRALVAAIPALTRLAEQMEEL